MKGSTYEEKLRELNLPSLEERRREMDMAQVFKIVKRIDDVNGETWFSMAGDRRPTRATTGAYPLLPKRSAHEFRRNFFSQRTVHEWNNLPDEIKMAANPTAFKRQYRRMARTGAQTRRPN